MGDVRGCIFSLVTISKMEGREVSGDAQHLLEILASRNQNVVQMANANYFKPLLQLLTSGYMILSLTKSIEQTDQFIHLEFNLYWSR